MLQWIQRLGGPRLALQLASHSSTTIQNPNSKMGSQNIGAGRFKRDSGLCNDSQQDDREASGVTESHGTDRAFSEAWGCCRQHRGQFPKEHPKANDDEGQEDKDPAATEDLQEGAALLADLMLVALVAIDDPRKK